jgi:hypothetical protein
VPLDIAIFVSAPREAPRRRGDTFFAEKKYPKKPPASYDSLLAGVYLLNWFATVVPS